MALNPALLNTVTVHPAWEALERGRRQGWHRSQAESTHTRVQPRSELGSQQAGARGRLWAQGDLGQGASSAATQGKGRGGSRKMRAITPSLQHNVCIYNIAERGGHVINDGDI